MRTPPKHLLASSALLVVAVVVGAGAPGQAAGNLGKGAVKKIAAKVVKKSAPSLSVDHARTADDASTLAGKPASAYGNRVYRYALQPGSDSAEHSFTFPGLPPGTYSYSYTAAWLPPSTMACYLLAGGTGPFEGLSYSTTNGGVSTCNASGVIVVTPGAAPLLIANRQSGSATTTLRDPASAESEVVFTPVDTLVASTAGGS